MFLFISPLRGFGYEFIFPIIMSPLRGFGYEFVFPIIMSALRAFINSAVFYNHISLSGFYKILHCSIIISALRASIIYFFFLSNRFQSALPSFYLFYKKTTNLRQLKMVWMDKCSPAFGFLERPVVIAYHC